MPHDITHPFSGQGSASCSYVAQHLAKNADYLKAKGLSEASYEKSVWKGELESVLAQDFTGIEADVLIGVAERTSIGAFTNEVKSLQYRFYRRANGQITMQSKSTTTGEMNRVVLSESDFRDLLDTIDNGSFKVKFGTKAKMSDLPAVESNPTAVGKMTDKDMAALFVKTKDDFAKAKGLNVKGSNPLLDAEVYDSLAKFTGYTPANVKAKIDRYKATGAKLSSLKKQVQAGTYKVPDPPKAVVPESTPQLPKPAVAKKAVAPDPDKVKMLPGEVADFDAQYHGKVVATMYENGDGTFSVYLKKPDGTWLNQPKVAADPASAKHVAQKWADQEWKETPNPPKPANDWESALMGEPENVVAKTKLPPGVEEWYEVAEDVKVDPTLSPSQSTVNKAVQDLNDKNDSGNFTMTDEDIVAEYIKAKDYVAAQPDNPFTLYSTGNDYDQLIFQRILSQGIDLDKYEDVLKAIATYKGQGNKLSTLKKKLIKSGAMDKKADTKKGSATTKAEAKADVKAKAESGYTPAGAGEPLTGNSEIAVFSSLKNTIYNSMSDSALYDAILKQSTLMSHPGYPVSPLQVVRAYDKMKSAQLGIENGFFYEKRLANFLSTPEGRNYLKSAQEKAIQAAQAAKKAEEAEALAKKMADNQPALPPDSALFKEFTTSQARQMQMDMGSWTSEQRAGLRTYTGGSYRQINDSLRKGNKPRAGSTAANAQAGMRPTTQDLLVHRGTSASQFGMGGNPDALFSLAGQTIKEKGFTSTSVGGNAAFGGQVKMVIQVPKGTYGAYVDTISQFPGEREFLLAHGTEFKILRVEKSYNQYTVYVRAVPGSQG